MSAVVCAWCLKVIGEVATEDPSHGICAACAAQLYKELDEGTSSPEQQVTKGRAMIEKCCDCGHWGRGQCAIFGSVPGNTHRCAHALPNEKRDGTPIKPSFDTTGRVKFRTLGKPKRKPKQKRDQAMAKNHKKAYGGKKAKQDRHDNPQDYVHSNLGGESS